MKAKDIVKKIEEFAPASLACTWDNVGFLCGDSEMNVEKVLVTLDVNLNTVDEAIKFNADMIISHHPIFLSGLKRIDFSTPEGKVAELLIKNDIAVVSAHTNMDAAENGINQRLAEIFELENISVLEPIDEKTGIGRFGVLPEEVDAEDFAETVKDKLCVPFVRISGKKKIKKLAICSGSGADYFGLAKENGCDALLTGDVKYHTAMSAKESGICLIDAGHFPTEKIVCDIFEEILRNLPIEIVKSNDTDVFNII